MDLMTAIRANGAAVSSRETDDHTAPGGCPHQGRHRHRLGGGQLPAALAAERLLLDRNPAGTAAQAIIIGHSGQQTASNSQQNRNDMRKNRDGINAKLEG